MKKNSRRRIITIILAAIAGECAAILLIVLVLVYGGPVNPVPENTVAAIGRQPEEGPPFDIDATVEPTAGRVLITEIIRLKAAARNVNLYLPSANKAKTVIRSITCNGQVMDYSRNGTDLLVKTAGMSTVLGITYEIFPGTKPEILSWTRDRLLLTNFLAVPALQKGSVILESYGSRLGDPYLYDAFSYRVKVKADKGFSVFGPGRLKQEAAGSLRATSFEAQNLRDFPLVLYKNAKVSEIRQGKTSLILVNADSAKGSAAYALSYAEALIGPYPYKELFIVGADFPLRGMEFSNMIFISENLFKNKDALKRVVYHEVLHQWFYGIIGTDQLNEPFMDEGLVTYLTSYMCRDRLGSSYDSRFINLKLKDYTSKEAYNRLAYVEASKYFGQLHSKMGNDFIEMLKRIYSEKKYKTLYFDDFNKYLNQFSRGK